MTLNWSDIWNNAIGNGISDIFIGFLIAYIVTKYFELVNHERKSIGSLKLIQAELTINSQILDMLTTGFSEFEKAMHRENGHVPPRPVFQDFSQTTKDYYESALCLDAYYSLHEGLGNLTNEALTTKIINNYASLKLNLRSAFQIGEMNWEVFDTYKVRIKQISDNLDDVKKEITEEIVKLKKTNKLQEIFHKSGW